MNRNDQSFRDHNPAERLAAIEASAAWAVARRLTRLRQRLAPDGSRRLAVFRRAVRGLRLWRREGLWAVCRRIVARRRQLPAAVPPSVLSIRGPDRTGGAPVPGERTFRVAFVGSTAVCEAQSMRYRAYNVIEALATVGLEGTFVAREEVAQKAPLILSHDLIVLTRLMDCEPVAALVEAAGRDGIPVVYDIDDYLFEPWVMPYVEAFRALRPADARQAVELLGGCLRRCDYFTGSTSYLARRAAALGKTAFVLPNGLNAAQLERARRAVERRAAGPRDGLVRLGYFSGTRTHQADFRVAYPALMALLRDEPAARLVVVGDLDLGEFAGLAPFAGQIEVWPLRPWQDLPDAVAAIDVNLIPLELTPFNEGKSNLKYFEAGLCRVPSVASPTGILRESIMHGHNGLLARTDEEWYDGLRALVRRREWREEMGRNACAHVLRTYTPAATAAEAAAVYRRILRAHRRRRGIADVALGVVVLLPGPDRAEERAAALRRAEEVAAVGHGVTVYASPGEAFASAEELKRSLGEPRFEVQLGGDVPCCHVLLSADEHTAELAQANARRADVIASVTAFDYRLREAA